MNNQIDIASLEIAENVHKSVNTEFYAYMLQAMQKTANNLGYVFSTTEESIEKFSDEGVDCVMPAVLKKCLANEVSRARAVFLRPDDDIEECCLNGLNDGYSLMLLKSMIDALKKQGICLQIKDKSRAILIIQALVFCAIQFQDIAIEDINTEKGFTLRKYSELENDDDDERVESIKFAKDMLIESEHNDLFLSFWDRVKCEYGI